MDKLEKIFSQDPESSVFPILAGLYYQKRSYQNAARVCQKGLKHDPSSIPGQYILAKLLILKKETILAEKILKKIIITEPQHLNALLLLVSIMKETNRSLQAIIPWIKKSAQLYPSNNIIQSYYAEYCTQESTGKKKKNKSIKKIEQYKSNFTLNPKLATKTLYHLFYSQQKYSDAQNILVIMQNGNKNKTFVSNEMKKIQNKLSKG